MAIEWCNKKFVCRAATVLLLMNGALKATPRNPVPWIPSVDTSQVSATKALEDVE
jgi:hypothetical protein